jgi:hypothetical protein
MRLATVRVYLALYAGIGTALLLSSSIQLHGAHERVKLTIRTSALEAALPAIGFWVVAGLCWAFGSSSDPSAGWAFRLTGGEPTVAQLNTVRTWVAVHGSIIITAAALALGAVAHWFGQDWRPAIAAWFVSVGLCWVAADLCLFDLMDIPFVRPRPTRNTELAWVLLRYIVLLPAALAVARLYEKWVGFHVFREVLGVLIMIALHLTLQYFASRFAEGRPPRSETLPLTDILQGLGLQG